MKLYFCHCSAAAVALRLVRRSGVLVAPLHHARAPAACCSPRSLRCTTTHAQQQPSLPDLSAPQLKQLTKAQLQARAKQLKVPASGTKDDLVFRILQAQAAEAKRAGLGPLVDAMGALPAPSPPPPAAPPDDDEAAKPRGGRGRRRTMGEALKSGPLANELKGALKDGAEGPDGNNGVPPTITPEGLTAKALEELGAGGEGDDRERAGGSGMRAFIEGPQGPSIMVQMGPGSGREFLELLGRLFSGAARGRAATAVAEREKEKWLGEASLARINERDASFGGKVLVRVEGGSEREVREKIAEEAQLHRGPGVKIVFERVWREEDEQDLLSDHFNARHI